MSEKNSEAGISGNGELTFEMTPEKYDEMKKRGIDEDAIPAVGVHKLKRLNKRIKPAESKVKISLEIDGDVLQYFRQRAERHNAESYQAQVNAELRKIMERELAENDAEARKNVELLIKDKEFIRAVAEQLKELQAA